MLSRAHRKPTSKLRSERRFPLKSRYEADGISAVTEATTANRAHCGPLPKHCQSCLDTIRACTLRSTSNWPTKSGATALSSIIRLIILIDNRDIATALAHCPTGNEDRPGHGPPSPTPHRSGSACHAIHKGMSLDPTYKVNGMVPSTILEGSSLIQN